MDPQLIPYGWGLFSEKEEVILVEQQVEDVKEKEVLMDIPPNMGNHLIRIVTQRPEVAESSLLQPPEVKWPRLEGMQKLKLTSFFFSVFSC